MDRWVETGIRVEELPEKLGVVLNRVEQIQTSQFPYTWLQFIETQQPELISAFLRLFQEQISSTTATQLRDFIEKGQRKEGGLTWRILNRLEELVAERNRLKNQIAVLRKRLKDKEKEAHSLNYQEEVSELKRERLGLMELVRRINEKNTFNFFTDEGLLPNYAFPEPGVTLRSIIWRKKSISGDSQGNQYETFSFEYERPGAIAIRELVPQGIFYAEGKRVSIDQIDLNLSQIEEWRLCRNCSYASPTILPEAQTRTCPRCGDYMWSDEGRKRKMVRLRQVTATTSARDSRIGDDRDDRSSGFFTRQMLVDFEPNSVETSYLIDDQTFPFGFEFLSRVTFREINFGQSSSQAENFELAGESLPRGGFRICRHCGKVQNGRGSKDHALTCRIRNQVGESQEKDYLDVLYLFRQFESEAIRFLIPIDILHRNEELHSFIASLQLGLKRYFKGNVDHLKTLIIQEPYHNSSGSSLRKPFLFLYDTVPGGTGYLRQLLQQPENLFTLLEESLRVIRNCNCIDGCYNCLYAYRNSFDRDRTSKRVARDLLNEILSRKDQLKPHTQGLSGVPLNSLFDSVLEQRFIEALRRYCYQEQPTIVRKEIVRGKEGYFVKIGEMSYTVELQVTLGPEQGVSRTSRADFVFYPTKNTANLLPIAIFTDGWEYHHSRLEVDFDQRMAIAQSGNYHLWSLTWLDVDSQFNKQGNQDYFLNFLTTNTESSFEKNKTRIYQQYGCQQFLSLIEANSFIWLMNFLASPDRDLWTKSALVSALSHRVPKSEQWLTEVQEVITPEIWSEFAHLANPQFFGKMEYESLVELYTAIAPSEHKVGSPESCLIALSLNQKDQRVMKQNQWPIPEIGYDLANEKGTVIATAEFAWEEKKTVLLLEEDEDFKTFQASGWNVSTIATILPQPEFFRQMYLF